MYYDESNSERSCMKDATRESISRQLGVGLEVLPFKDFRE